MEKKKEKKFIQEKSIQKTKCGVNGPTLSNFPDPVNKS